MNRESCDFCEFCEGSLHKRVVQARFSYMGRTLYIDQVPARVCDRCGEQYYEGRVYERMVEIAKDPHRVQGTVVFPLAQFGADPPAPAAERGPEAPRASGDALSLTTYCSPARGVGPNAYATAGPDANECPMPWRPAGSPALSD